ncbi:MAG: hypothetical protein JNM94_03405 [Phycisphaerae bacterium]|nr:hypothetical protein [Phycisphaerae bacterium]
MQQLASSPRWLFEYARGKRVVTAFVATVCVAAVARALFRTLKIEHPIRPGRLCALAILVLSLLYVISWLQVGAATLRLVTKARADAARLTARDLVGGTVNGVMILPTTRIEMDPIGWRESAVALAWSFVAPASDARVVFRRNVSLSTTLQPPVLSMRAGFDSALPQSSVSDSFSRWTNLAATPLEVARVFPPSVVWREHSEFYRDVLSLVTMIACSCATFVVLPFARTRAKVRWAQIGRASVYLLASLPVWLLVFGMVGLGRAWYGPGADLLFNARPILGLAVFLWLSTWWYSAVGGYLRMERPLAVALSVASIGVLAGTMLILALQILLAGS